MRWHQARTQPHTIGERRADMRHMCASHASCDSVRTHRMTPEKPKRALPVVFGFEPKTQFHEKVERCGGKRAACGVAKNCVFWKGGEEGFGVEGERGASNSC